MLSHYPSRVSRILFVAACVLAGLAVWEKLANFFGFTLNFIGGYQPSRLLELAVVALLFVIALELRALRGGQDEKGPA